MDRLNKIELIQLYTAGCISQPDKIILKSLMENDENFPWAELADVTRIRNNVQAAINSLTDAQKSLLDLSYYEGLDESMIAERLKIPVSSVKSKLRLVNASLMKQIFNDRI